MFCSQRPCCLSETLNFTTECVAELLAKSANAKVHFFSTVNEGENAQSKKKWKDLVSQGSVSGIMPSYCTLKWTCTFMEWVTSRTMSSLSHNEEIVGGNGHGVETMWQRGVPKIEMVCQIAVCSVWKWPDSLENNKEFWMGKHKGFHRALYWLVLDELKWLWLLAKFPGVHWRQFQ